MKASRSTRRTDLGKTPAHRRALSCSWMLDLEVVSPSPAQQAPACTSWIGSATPFEEFLSRARRATSGLPQRGRRLCAKTLPFDPAFRGCEEPRIVDDEVLRLGWSHHRPNVPVPLLPLSVQFFFSAPILPCLRAGLARSCCMATPSRSQPRHFCPRWPAAARSRTNLGSTRGSIVTSTACSSLLSCRGVPWSSVTSSCRKLHFR